MEDHLPNKILNFGDGYRIVSLGFTMTFAGLLVGKPLDAYHDTYLPEMKKWHAKLGNFIVNMEKLGAIESSEHLPVYCCEIEMEDPNLNWLRIRFYTHLKLDQFLSQIDGPFKNINLTEIFKLKGEEFNP